MRKVICVTTVKAPIRGPITSALPISIGRWENAFASYSPLHLPLNFQIKQVVIGVTSWLIVILFIWEE